jgi:hypothetical protein
MQGMQAQMSQQHNL